MAFLSYEKEFFNNMLAHVRIKSEHCIGILKSRFPTLKKMNVWIKEGPKEVKYIVDLITSCIVLHNLLLECNDPIPQEWYNELSMEIDWDINNSDHSSDSAAPWSELSDSELIKNDARESVYKNIINNYL